MVWIVETRSENGYELQRADLKKGVGKLHILVKQGHDLENQATQPHQIF